MLALMAVELGCSRWNEFSRKLASALETYPGGYGQDPFSYGLEILQDHFTLPYTVLQTPVV